MTSISNGEEYRRPTEDSPPDDDHGDVSVCDHSPIPHESRVCVHPIRHDLVGADRRNRRVGPQETKVE